jgi:ribose transport system ATP-binding protein
MTEAPPDILLRADGIAKAYGPVIALRSVNLSVAAGEIHGLLGANGAGKSTMVKILSGVISRDSGSIAINGEPVDLDSPNDSFSAGIATVFQDPALIPDLTISQNLKLTNLEPSVVRNNLESMDLGGLDFDLMVRDVPLAVLRLLDLARALAHDPQILLLDEITAALSSDQAEHVFNVMRAWKAKGRSVLFISHRLDEVLRICDTATILRNGSDVETLELAGVDEARLVHAMVGDAADQTTAVPAVRDIPSSARVALRVDSLTSRDTIKGVSFEVRQGEILGFAALEGQGQDRLFDLLSGNRRADGGSIEVLGEPLKPRSPYDAIAKGVVLVPSDRLQALLPQRSVRENLSAPLYNRVRRWFGLVGDELARVNSAIDRLDIDVRAQSQVRRLSGGNQQKVTIGRWLASGFQTLLCNDPTRGIDIQTKAQIYDLLKELASEGAAIVLYTSELREIPLVCDRVLVMYDGEIVDEQVAAHATEESLLTAAHGLEEVS